MIHQDPSAVTEEFIGGAMAMVAHTAYHLGQIRHALCMLSLVPEDPMPIA